MRNYVQAGNAVTVPAPAGGVISGAGVLVDHLFGVAATTAAEADEFELVTVGVFDLTKSGGEVFTLGAPAYWDVATDTVTPVATDNLRIGTAIQDAGGSAATVRVKIDGHAI
ncbi:DUF2190 family protein [Labrenzia sp. R4_2]|uniref:DUF2190 family protein n=1 Tax=Labrenzia sp. R4_2 TaxID=2821107 RepID=UPI001ADBEBE3|nr:DUF2190 family protein [Labrenzia sp. R4_2]MBO9422326.1 DUF2190 family protein [Labrenzia sp. R4_2]